jgi:proteasome lid subunit RPN8/RPN11
MLRINKKLIDELWQDARVRLPHEACGYVAGTGEDAAMILPLSNIDKSEEHFSFDPAEQFEALRKARSAGIELLAVYHSHPKSPARMSEEDKHLAYDTNIIYVICSLLSEEIKAFSIDEAKNVEEIILEVTE